MSTPIVVDASVALKWVLLEEFSGNALALLEQSATGQQPIISPPLLPIEVTNAVYQRLRRRDITEYEATSALVEFAAFGLQPVPVGDLHQRAFQFAHEHELRNIYDCVYLVLAQQVNAELWTADRRFFNAVSSIATWTRWIAEHPA